MTMRTHIIHARNSVGISIPHTAAVVLIMVIAQSFTNFHHEVSHQNERDYPIELLNFQNPVN